jgi:hypothetical protein
LGAKPLTWRLVVVTGRNGPNVRQVIQGDLADLPDDTSAKWQSHRQHRGRATGARGAQEIGNKDCAARGVRGCVVATKPREQNAVTRRQ